MHTVNINIAPMGHSMYGGADHSRPGHMWFSLEDGSSMGYVPGGVTGDDNRIYDPGYIKYQIEMTDEQYQDLEYFFDNQDEYGFGSDAYSAFDNNCITYVWAGLSAAGLNPDGYKGEFWPWSNVNALILKVPPSLPQWVHDIWNVLKAGTDKILTDNASEQRYSTIYDANGNPILQQNSYISKDGTIQYYETRDGKGNFLSYDLIRPNSLGGVTLNHREYKSDGPKEENGRGPCTSDVDITTDREGNTWTETKKLDSNGNVDGKTTTYHSADGTYSYEEKQNANGKRLSSESITKNPDGSITKESIKYGEDGSVDSKTVKKILPDGSEEISDNPDKTPPVVPEPPVPLSPIPLAYEPGANPIDPSVGGLWDGAKSLTSPRVDPLALDLDGDGFETTGIDTANPTYFDHDNDGIKSATGWIGSDDGFLVMDRNGNGTIDNGGELFGNATSLGDGSTAEDGFAALYAEDTNADGKVDAGDAHYADLRVWRDLNSDGLSQSGELFTLESLGIASLNVAKTEHSSAQANGNTIADLGSYTRTDGSTGTMGDIDFRENTFLSRFADAVPISAEAALLPNMYGAGQVRCLREAASLSPALATALAAYAAATSGDEQKAMLDNLLKAWSDTSPLAATATGAYAGHALTVTFQNIAPGSPEHQDWLEKLTILERFNGQTFRDVPAGSGAVSLDFFSQQIN